MCAVTAATVMAVGAGSLGAIGDIKNSQAQASADKYNANIAEQNAGVAQQQAAAAAQIQREQALRSMGSTTAAYGASGVTTDTGTALDVLAESASNAERDRQNITYKGALEAAGYTDQAQLDRFSASNALEQGYFSAAGSLMSTGSKVASMSAGGGKK